MKSLINTSFVLSVFIVFMTFPRSLAQPPEIEWAWTYGGTESDIAYSVQQTIDGGYIFAGYTKSFGADSNDVYLVKTGSFGNLLWYRLYGGPDYDEGRSVQQTTDGGYIVAGWTKSFGIGSSNMYLIKTDSHGDTLWTRTYGGTYINSAKSVQQTLDGGYVIAGYTRPNISDLTRMYLVKVDSLGDTLWTHSYAGSDNRSAYDVKQTNDHGYILVGGNPHYGGVEYDIYLIRTNSVGDTLWTRTFGGENEDYALSVQQTTDGGYIVAGWMEFTGTGYTDFYVVKTDSSGDTLWTRTYGGEGGESASSIQQTADGGYIIAGVTGSFGAVHGDLYLVKIDSQGDTLWTLVYAGEGYDMITSLDQTTSNGYIVAGYTYPDYFDPADCWLVKTGPDTAVSRAPVIQWVSHPKDFILHSAYPNPFNPTTTISYAVPVRGIVKVDIYNVLGQKTVELVNGVKTSGRHQMIWNAGDLPSGIYFVQISARIPSGQARDFSQVRKILLLK